MPVILDAIVKHHCATVEVWEVISSHTLNEHVIIYPYPGR